MCIQMGKLTYWIQPSWYWTFKVWFGLDTNIAVFNKQDDHIVEFRIQTVYSICKEKLYLFHNKLTAIWITDFCNVIDKDNSVNNLTPCPF